MYGSFPNFGFLRDEIPKDLLEDLTKEIEDLDTSRNKYNMRLAGNIESEYQLNRCAAKLEKYLLTLCEQYETGHSLNRTSKDLRADNLELQSYWVNIQKKNEFNPMHTHDGTYSFVIWIKVPYRIQDELEHPSVKLSNLPRAGMFSFIYTNAFGEVRESEFPVDQTFEGNIFLFPSCLPHMVYPFNTSDETRISISGNLHRKQWKT
jgi:uncharacterized protein (TIGR02466 family)